MIEVRLFATFRQGREKIYHVDAENYSNTGEIIDAFGIPREEVAILLINGRHSTPDVRIKDGDVIALFPPVGGG